ncbi:MAG: hypothetical protein QM666_10650 [Acinetobacter sp.]
MSDLILNKNKIIALLMVKQEIQHCRKNIEHEFSTWTYLNQWGLHIHDISQQLWQCCQVIRFIHEDELAHLSQLCSDLFKQMIQPQSEVSHQHMQSLAEGLLTLERYIEYVGQDDREIPQLLLKSINQIEIALHQPLSREGKPLQAIVTAFTPSAIDDVAPIEHSQQIHLLYQSSLQQILDHDVQAETEKGLQYLAHYLTFHSRHTPSEKYWSIIAASFQQLKLQNLSAARLRTLIQAERHLEQFIQEPDHYTIPLEDIADALMMLVSQNTIHAKQLRQRYKLEGKILQDDLLEQCYKQFMSLEHSTTTLVYPHLNQVILNIIKQLKQQQDLPQKISSMSLQQQLQYVGNFLSAINLHTAGEKILAIVHLEQAQFNEKVTIIRILEDAMIQLIQLQNRYTPESLRIVLPINIDEYHPFSADVSKNIHPLLEAIWRALKNIDLSTQQHKFQLSLMTTAIDLLAQLAQAFASIFGEHKIVIALKHCTAFLQQHLKTKSIPTTTQIQQITNVCACADMLFKNYCNAQPIYSDMLDIALTHSQQLKSVA